MAKILLVEDNEMNRDMLSRRLKKKGYEGLLKKLEKKAGIKKKSVETSETKEVKES